MLPKFLAYFGAFYSAQCLTYHGPDTKYEGSDICYSFNEVSLFIITILVLINLGLNLQDAFTIYGINNTTAPVVISTTPYYGVSYSHQGWVVDENWQRYLLLDDELDEVFSKGRFFSTCW